jgi:hypothetical protein
MLVSQYDGDVKNLDAAEAFLFKLMKVGGDDVLACASTQGAHC